MALIDATLFTDEGDSDPREAVPREAVPATAALAKAVAKELAQEVAKELATEVVDALNRQGVQPAHMLDRSMSKTYRESLTSIIEGNDRLIEEAVARGIRSSGGLIMPADSLDSHHRLGASTLSPLGLARMASEVSSLLLDFSGLVSQARWHLYQWGNIYDSLSNAGVLPLSRLV